MSRTTTVIGILVVLALWIGACDTAGPDDVIDDPVEDPCDPAYVGEEPCEPIDVLPIVAWRHLWDGDRSVVFAPSDSLFYRIEPDAVKVSSDHGQTWFPTASALPNGWPRMGDPAGVTPGGAILVMLSGKETADEARNPYRGLARSSDGGSMFEEITPDWLGPASFDVRPTRIQVDAQGTVLAVADDGSDSSVFRSADGGSSWIPVLGTQTCCAGLSSGPDGLYWIASGGRKLHRSLDGGITWATLPDGPFETVGEVALTGAHGSFLVGFNVLGGNVVGSLFRSTDRGDSWSRLNAFTPSQSILHVAAGSNDHLFVVVSEADVHSVWRSTDGGDSWTSEVEGLPESVFGTVDGRITDLLMSPDGHLLVYVGDSMYGTSVAVGRAD